MDQENVYSISEFKKNVAACIDEVETGRVVYIRDAKRRNIRGAALVSIADGKRIEQMRADTPQVP